MGKDNNRAYAKSLMVHYFKTVWPQDKQWHSDNQVELELLVDAIVNAAVVATTKLLAETVLEEQD
jgi:hypothetical protein